MDIHPSGPFHVVWGETAKGEHDLPAFRVEARRLPPQHQHDLVLHVDPGIVVVLVLQACYSGGMSEATKGLDLSGQYFDFIGGELARTKDVGQKDAAMLCASDSHEVSFNRPEGDMSVMYYFLCKKMTDDPRVTLARAYDYLKVEVPAYLRQRSGLYEGKSQTPILVNQFGTIFLRP